MSKMNLLNYVNVAVEQRNSFDQGYIQLNKVKEVLMKTDQIEIIGQPKTMKNKSTAGPNSFADHISKHEKRFSMLPMPMKQKLKSFAVNSEL